MSSLPQDLHTAAGTIKTATDDIVRVESIKDTDYIAFHTKSGSVYTVLRADALLRAGTLLEMIERETNSARPEDVDKHVTLCLMTLRAAIENGRQRGKSYATPAIKTFEQRLLKAEKSWRNRADMLDDVRVRSRPKISEE